MGLSRRRVVLDRVRKSACWRYLRAVFLVHKALVRDKDIVAQQRLPRRELPIFIASESDINEAYRDIWVSPDRARELIRQGHILFLWKENDEYIMYQWVKVGRVSVSYLDIPGIDLPADVAYYGGAYVPPSHAGRMVLKRAINSMEQQAIARGIHTIFTVIKSRDEAINRFHSKCLYTRAFQEVTYIRLGPLRIYRVESLEHGERRWFLNTSSFWNLYSPLLRSACEAAGADSDSVVSAEKGPAAG